jgi:methionyl-tRNA formyltransferase
VSGRGRALAETPVKSAAQALGLTLLQPPRIKGAEAVAALRAFAPELQIVIAYGQILPRGVIDAAPLGTVNVHASLLPRYRGAAPIQWAIASGEAETGVSTMLIDEGLDTGPLLLSERTPIGPDETAGQLESRLAQMGAEVLLRTVHGLRARTIGPTPQSESLATYAPLLHKEDARIDWTREAGSIARRVRAFNPWPVAFTLSDQRVLRILAARSEPGRVEAPPGRLVTADRNGILIACGGGSLLRVLELQPESKRPMTAAAFVAGARLAPGARFE